jgi:phospholipid/cholesterol/gamma-HCH transport system substrate-binding protein
MDKKIANNIIVGIVVTIGFIGFLFLLFNVGGGEGIFTPRFRLFSRFTEVKGLHYGSEVSLAGLHIGIVKGIVISKDGGKQLIVELAIDKDYEDRIREDSVAAIKTQGVLGDKYVELSIGSPEKPALQSGAEVKAHAATSSRK